MNKPHKNYYNPKETLKKPCTKFWVYSDRGVGKTTGAIKTAIDEFIKPTLFDRPPLTCKTIWVRRYQHNIKKNGKGCVFGFFNKLLKVYPEYAKYKLTTKNSEYGYITIDGKEYQFMQFMALSKQESYKGNEYDDYCLMFYDEFQKEKSTSHYLPNEFEQLINLYITIDRYDGRVKMMCMSNAVNVANPHFDALGVKTFNGRYWYKMVDGKCVACVENYKNMGFVEDVEKDDTTLLLRGTKFGGYVLGNKFLENNEDFIAKRNGNCVYWLTLAVNQKRYAVWLDKINGCAYIDRAVDNTCNRIYGITNETFGDNVYTIKTAKYRYDFGMLIDMLKVNNVRFCDMSAKEDCYVNLYKCM